MGCAYCTSPVWASVRTGIGVLGLCEACFGVWERRRGGAPLQKWIREIKPPARSYTACPSCGATPDQIRQTGLYGCCFCYVFLQVRL
ncbi:MAG: hypothetical protein N2045_07655 [Fimbriimonadales bacterium]|jgi:hypothetical protein|nr:hypothetical protein [Fimbriimonadales bacterium]GBC91160.1 hypothetical protein HRbin14_01918 [bacterium HR14]GIV12924.1 MAG: hypothetical protein KatS3mg021_1206 [Fimbriimonadales bacterium]CUU06008.1 hypothetical protein GBSOP10_104463 [Armatimonadetes bacterium GBS]CUU37826.1 hypothetical protein GXSOP10_13476 [Armatimonadetes bacterium GXS]